MYKVQSVLINKHKYTLREAENFILDSRYFKLKKMDETKNEYRFRQIDPNYLHRQGYNKIITKKLGRNSGIELVIYYKE